MISFASSKFSWSRVSLALYISSSPLSIRSWASESLDAAVFFKVVTAAAKPWSYVSWFISPVANWCLRSFTVLLNLLTASEDLNDSIMDFKISSKNVNSSLLSSIASPVAFIPFSNLPIRIAASSSCFVVYFPLACISERIWAEFFPSLFAPPSFSLRALSFVSNTSWADESLSVVFFSALYALSSPLVFFIISDRVALSRSFNTIFPLLTLRYFCQSGTCCIKSRAVVRSSSLYAAIWLRISSILLVIVSNLFAALSSIDTQFWVEFSSCSSKNWYWAVSAFISLILFFLSSILALICSFCSMIFSYLSIFSVACFMPTSSFKEVYLLSLLSQNVNIFSGSSVVYKLFWSSAISSLIFVSSFLFAFISSEISFLSEETNFSLASAILSYAITYPLAVFSTELKRSGESESISFISLLSIVSPVIIFDIAVSNLSTLSLVVSICSTSTENDLVTASVSLAVVDSIIPRSANAEMIPSIVVPYVSCATAKKSVRPFSALFR